MMPAPSLLTFDVFGTVVDLQNSVTREGEQLAISSAARHDGTDPASGDGAGTGRERRPDGGSPPAPLIRWLPRESQ